jgi:hypothetical protein
MNEQKKYPEIIGAKFPDLHSATPQRSTLQNGDLRLALAMTSTL